MNLYDIVVKDSLNQDVALSNYQGKVLLIVNTATGCGFTPQYKGLESLYKKYKDQGFEILDFPCNQFAHQAPGTEQEIKEFCELNYGTTFRLFHKIDVNGKHADPLYLYLRSVFKGIIKWNFTKFLVDDKGNVVKRFGPADKPESIEPFIAELLSKK